MAASDNVRVNQNAVTAARALLGPDIVNEDLAVDLIETVSVHIERPYQIALLAARRENEELRKLVNELTSAPTLS